MRIAAVLILLLLLVEAEVGVVIGDLRRGVLRRLLLLRGVEDRESRDGVGVNIVRKDCLMMIIRPEKMPPTLSRGCTTYCCAAAAAVGAAVVTMGYIAAIAFFREMR